MLGNGDPFHENETDKECIEFRFTSSRVKIADKRRFADSVRSSLESRGLRTRGRTLGEMVTALRKRLMQEQHYDELTMVAKHVERDDGALYDTSQVVTCILHLEMRVVQREGNSSRLKITRISFTKFRARRFMLHIDNIIEFCYESQPAKGEELKTALGHFKEALAIMGLKRDLSIEDADAFQDHIDSFYRFWIKTYGLEGCTNYIHLLSAGHIKEEMIELGNLYRYSQEGVEAMIALVKSYFFRRTMRGGGRSIENSNKVLPLAKWLQRRMYFLFTWARDDFEIDATGPIVGDLVAVDEDDETPVDEYNEEAIARDQAEAYLQQRQINE